MPSRHRLIVVGVVTFIFGIIALFPARVLYRWISPPGVAIAGINGTIWRGSAKHLLISGVYASEIEWRAKPLAFFTAKLALALKAKPGSGFVESDVAFGLGNNIRLSDLSGSLPLSLLQQTLQTPGLQGNASIQFERLQFSSGLLVAAIGSAEVSGLVIPAVAQSGIGGYRATFSTADDIVSANIEDTDGVIDIVGNLNLTADRNYEFRAQIAPKAGAPQSLAQQMKFLGNPNDSGQYELRLDGQL